MKILEIARSFSKTIQQEQFEPLNVFASYKGELDGTETKEDIQKFSEELFLLAQEDVRRVTDMWTNRRAAMKRIREAKEVPFESGETFYKH